MVVPSYNGGEVLKTCVQSVLAQQHDSFDLVVLDDCSDDGSLSWLQQQGAKVRLYPSTERLGITGNWGRIAEVPTGQWMTIIGQDDVLDPHYLATMDRLIAEHPDASLYHTHFRFIDRTGALLRSCRPLPARETAAGYIAALFSHNRDTHGAGYLWRSEDYRSIGGIPPYPGLLFADDALWISMMRPGYKATAAQECFSVRKHHSSAGAAPNWRTWCGGMRLYLPFLREVARDDEEFNQALELFGPDYFVNWCVNIYKLALMQATQRNEKARTAEIAAEICDALSVGAPQWLPRFQRILRTSQGLRLRQAINRHGVTRRLYNAHLKVRLRD